MSLSPLNRCLPRLAIMALIAGACLVSSQRVSAAPQWTQADLDRHTAIAEQFWNTLLNGRTTGTNWRKIVTPDVVFIGSLSLTQYKGVAGIEKYAAMLGKNFQNYRVRIHNAVAERSKVVARVNLSGVNIGSLYGYPATHKVLDYPAVAYMIFEGDQIKRIEVTGSILDVLLQISPKDWGH